MVIDMVKYKIYSNRSGLLGKKLGENIPSRQEAFVTAIKYLSQKDYEPYFLQENGKIVQHKTTTITVKGGNTEIFIIHEKSPTIYEVAVIRHNSKIAGEPGLKKDTVLGVNPKTGEFTKIIVGGSKTKSTPAVKKTPVKAPVRKSIPRTNFIKTWYCAKYPSDDLGQRINPKATFDGAYSAIFNGRDFYDYIEVGDSVVRERVFTEIAKRRNLPYKYVYDLWLGD